MSGGCFSLRNVCHSTTQTRIIPAMTNTIAIYLLRERKSPTIGRMSRPYTSAMTVITLRSCRMLASISAAELPNQNDQNCMTILYRLSIVVPLAHFAEHFGALFGAFLFPLYFGLYGLFRV